MVHGLRFYGPPVRVFSCRMQSPPLDPRTPDFQRFQGLGFRAYSVFHVLSGDIESLSTLNHWGTSRPYKLDLANYKPPPQYRSLNKHEDEENLG